MKNTNRERNCEIILLESQGGELFNLDRGILEPTVEKRMWNKTVQPTIKSCIVSPWLQSGEIYSLSLFYRRKKNRTFAPASC